MFKHKLIGLAALVATAALTFGAASASAFTNAPVGSTVTGNLVSARVKLGTFSECTGSAVSGTVAADLGPGNGGSGQIRSASFSGCTVFGSSATVTANALPWTLSVDGAGNMSLTGVDVTLRWGLLNCSFRGSLTGAYNQTTGDVVLAGSLSRYSGSSLCPSPSAVEGTYRVLNDRGVPVLL